MENRLPFPAGRFQTIYEGLILDGFQMLVRKGRDDILAHFEQRNDLVIGVVDPHVQGAVDDGVAVDAHDGGHAGADRDTDLSDADQSAPADAVLALAVGAHADQPQSRVERAFPDTDRAKAPGAPDNHPKGVAHISSILIYVGLARSLRLGRRTENGESGQYADQPGRLRSAGHR